MPTDACRQAPDGCARDGDRNDRDDATVPMKHQPVIQRSTRAAMPALRDDARKPNAAGDAGAAATRSRRL